MKQRTRPARGTVFAFCVLSGVFFALPRLEIQAATRFMAGNTVCPDGSNWSTAACWVGGVAPVTGDDVILDNTQTGGTGNVPVRTVYDLGSTQLHSITLNSDDANCPCTIGGGPIVLQSGGFITDNFADSQADNFPGVTLNGPATFRLNSSSDSLRFTGAITGTGPLILNNFGPTDQLQLVSTANSWTGGTTIGGNSEVAAVGNGAIPTNSSVNMQAGTSLLFTASSTIGSLQGAGIVSMQNGTLTVGGDNTNTTFSGVYQNGAGGPASLTKVGGGTLTLSGTNTYTGATTVSAGTLVVNGSSASSSATVGSGATLTGTGTVSSIAASSGGAISGTMTATSGTTFAGGSSFNVTLTSATSYTRLSGGSVNLTAGPTLNVLVAGGFTPATGATFSIIPGAVTGTFNGLANGATFTAGGVNFRINYASATLTVLAPTAPPAPSNPTPVPMLSEWGLALTGILLAGLGAIAVRSTRRSGAW